MKFQFQVKQWYYFYKKWKGVTVYFSQMISKNVD